MQESVLKLNREIPWSPGIRQDYSILNNTGEVVGKLSITRFSAERPGKLNWLYINNVEIPDPENRGHGFAYNAMLEVNKLIQDEKSNAVLKNSIMDKNKKDFYRKLGWNKMSGVSGPWEFFMTQPMSVFVARSIVENVVRRNFVK